MPIRGLRHGIARDFISVRADILVGGIFAFIFGIQNFSFGQSFSLIYQRDGATADELGWSVAGVGDVDGDGRADFIVGAPYTSPGGLLGAGSAYVYSGATGALLYQKDGGAYDRLGFSVAGAGDMDGDGKADFLVGAPYSSPGGRTHAGSAYLYSGATGELLYQKDGAADGYYLGGSVTGAGDMDGDGRGDYIVGAPYASPEGRFEAGSAYVYSGVTGTLLFQKNGASDSDNFGYTVARAGDVDGDGKADFIVGAPYTSPGGLLGAGSAYLYSGATGTLIYQKDGTAGGDLFGVSVAGAGDVDGDGKADFTVGAIYSSPGGRTRAGSAYLYSGATGALLYQKDGAVGGDFLGVSVAGAGDADGDGRADFIAGAYYASPDGRTHAGSAYLYSGATGALLFQIDGAAFGDRLGRSVSGEVDVDGRTDFIVGAPYANPGGSSYAGSAYVYGLCSAKGDMDKSGDLTLQDAVLMLNCIFLSTGNCDICFADVNCSGFLSASDLVVELNMVFLGVAPEC